MRIAFYAPLRAPDSPGISGDLRVGRLLLLALRSLGHEVVLASRLRAYDRMGDPQAQRLVELEAAAERDRLAMEWRDAGAPSAWFTYHCYHKAPDLLGPDLTRQFGLPYLIAEPSYAARRSEGPWGAWLQAAVTAIRQANALLCLTREDLRGIGELAAGPERLFHLPPFLEALPERRSVSHGGVRLLAVGMMRHGDKLASYEQLAAALGRTPGDWTLYIAGDGPARPAVEAAFAPLLARVRFLGALTAADLDHAYAAADLMVWPAVNEAFGMAILEAQAHGLPVVAGAEHGVPDIVADGVTGRLCAPGDVAGFTAAVADLIGNPETRAAMGAAARQKVAAHHTLAAAQAVLTAALARALGR